MKHVKINRNEWVRGEGWNRSKLLRKRDGKKCCLGFMMLAAGYLAAELAGFRTPACVPGCNVPGLAKDQENSRTCNDLMQVNDNTEIKDQVRERKIIALALRIGIKVEFYN